MYVLQSDAKGVRQQMGLPTAESNADARYGFDGGCHAQVLKQLHVLGVKPNDWLLIRNLLKRYTMAIQVKNSQGEVTYLACQTPGGGGMVQGLSISSPLHTLLPRIYQELVETSPRRNNTHTPTDAASLQRNSHKKTRGAIRTDSGPDKTCGHKD